MFPSRGKARKDRYFFVLLQEFDNHHEEKGNIAHPPCRSPARPDAWLLRSLFFCHGGMDAATRYTTDLLLLQPQYISTGRIPVAQTGT